MLKSRNLVQPEDFSIKEIDEILDFININLNGNIENLIGNIICGDFNEKNIYLIDKNGMVFVLNPFAEKITDCTCIIEESVLGGCIFDGKAIYYIDEDGVQKMYNVVNKTFRI